MNAMKIGMLRQWLNEDRITDPSKMVTNEQVTRWLGEEPLLEHFLIEANTLSNATGTLIEFSLYDMEAREFKCSKFHIKETLSQQSIDLIYNELLAFKKSL